MEKKELVMKPIYRRYHAPDRHPVISKPFKLIWDGCRVCGELHAIGVGRYHSLDGRTPNAFTSTDWHDEPMDEADYL